jgi:secreted PhoX family phosphatase
MVNHKTFNNYSYKTLLTSNETYDNSKQIPSSFDGIVYVPIDTTSGHIFLNHEITNDGSLSKFKYVNGKIVSKDSWVGGFKRLCSNSLTPWGTVLTNEEQTFGNVIEVDVNTKKCSILNFMGKNSHENTIVVLSNESPMGHIFITNEDESTGGGCYKYVPTGYAIGTLYVMKIMNEQIDISDVSWIEVVPDNAQHAGHGKGTKIIKLEDLDYNTVDKCVYMCSTGANTNESIIYKLNLALNRIEKFFKTTMYNGVTLSHFDNVACDEYGNLYVTEDKPYSSLFKITPDKSIELILRAGDNVGELTGVTVYKDKIFTSYQNGRDYDELLEISSGVYKIEYLLVE